jgi:hypothetical protein
MCTYPSIEFFDLESYFYEKSNFKECPYCNWLMSETEYNAHRFDLGCPRCHTSFIEFCSVAK